MISCNFLRDEKYFFDYYSLDSDLFRFFDRCFFLIEDFNFVIKPI